MKTIIDAVRKSLTDDLLKPEYRNSGKHFTYGHCYAASEAIYHMAGGKGAGLRPFRAKDSDGVTHWWIVDHEGSIVDATAEQYTDAGKIPPYSSGRAGGFLTRNPSKRAQEIINRATLIIVGK